MFGYVGTGLGLFGTELLARKRAAGWLLCVAGDALWVVEGIVANHTAVWVCEGVYFLLRLRGYVRWKKSA